MGNNITLQRKVGDNVLVFSEFRDLDMFGIDTVKPVWLNMIEEGYSLILDLSRVVYIEANGIRAIAECANKAKERKLKVAVIPSGNITRLINKIRSAEIIPKQLDEALPPFFNTEEDAKNFLKN